MSYEQLHAQFKKISDLQHAQAMLSWDEAVMMPTGGGVARGESLATLAGIVHELVAAESIGDLAQAADAETHLDDWQRANVREIRRMWRRARAVPNELVVEFSRQTSACEQAWRTLRAENDWASIVEPLTRVVELTRRRGECIGQALGLEPYDALMDQYEPGMHQAAIDPIFDELKQALPAAIDRALATQLDVLPMPGPFTDEAQATLARTWMHRLGFDFTCGRVDTSHHPFCGGEPSDTRITTRYDNNDFLSSMFAVLHETGHAMYEQGLPALWRGQPVGASGGMALHESQSLFMEMQVCRSAEFLEYAAPIVRDALGGDVNDPAWSVENLRRAATRVERGYIRVDADEITYSLHVIARYELEKELVTGRMKVADIPDAWEAKMRDYLGLETAGNFRDGCMQDVHWFAGLVGYFPTYTLGALTAAQFFHAARDQLLGVTEAIRRGEFTELVDWLRSNVHGVGRSKSTAEIIETVSGRPLGTDAFIGHVSSRYGP